MKRITVVLFVVMVILQTGSAQNRFGFIGGGIYSKSNLKNQSRNAPETFAWNVELHDWQVVNNSIRNKITYAGKFSGYGGLEYDLKITNAFYIKSKLLFVSKGWNEKSDYRIDSVFFLDYVDSISTSIPHRNIPDESTKSDQVYSLGYLELPVTFAFYAPVRESLIFIGIGPYVSYGLVGKYRYRVTESNKQNRLDSTRNLNISFDGNTKNDLTARRLDYGAALEVGVEFRNRMFVTLNYTAGLVNVFEKRYWALQNRNRDLRIGFGYYLKNRQQRRF